MFNQKFLTVLILFLFGFYLISLKQGFYWDYPWIDMPLHFLGGFIAAAFLAIHFQSDIKTLSPLALILLLVGGTALLGMLWEFLEWLLDHYVILRHNFAFFQDSLDDTLLDLLMDVVGGFVVAILYLISRNLRKRPSS